MKLCGGCTANEHTYGKERKMELRVLKYFLMAAREENITRAAERMHITQPTLSRQLMQLEEELGTELFKRNKHSISLTEDGILLRQRAQEIVDIEDKIFQDLSHNDDILTGTITIGSGETQSIWELSSLIDSFRCENPNVKFEIYTGTADDIKDRMENGTVDIGLLTEPVDISKYDFIRMQQKDVWGVFIKKDAPLSEKEYISPEDLTGIPLIVPKRESVRNELANWFGDYYDKLDIAVNYDLLYNAAALVLGNAGAAVCLKSDVLSGELCFRTLRPALETGAVFVWKKHRAVSNAMTAFINYARKCLKDIM